jgi:hypothetical protein
MVEDGILRLKGRRGNIDKGVCPICRKEKGGRDKWSEKKFKRYIWRLEFKK